MSWSLNVPVVPTASFDKELGDAVSSPAPSLLSDKGNAQVATAKRMIKNAVKDMLAAEKHSHVFASANGHAEPQHPERDGYVSDYINISVQCGCSRAPQVVDATTPTASK